MTAVQPGWYQDPKRPPGHLRYWNGQGWTEQVVAPPRAPAAAGTPSGGVGGARRWLARHPWLGGAALVLVLVSAAASWGDDDPATPSKSSEASAPRESSSEDRSGAAPAPDTGDDNTQRRRRSRADRDEVDEPAERASRPLPRPATEPSSGPAPSPRTYLVTRIIDGDTLELGSGQDVRLVGIDTPEVGECGYDKAAANLSLLVLGKQVTLRMSDEDRDRYGRLLRYVNIGSVDAGLRLIKNGLAIARYDSRDGYGYHTREPSYIAADRAVPDVHCPRPAPLGSQQAPAPPPGSGCAPGYTPCVPPFPPDVDCADVDGPIRVTGTDPHGLDADGDGSACE